MPEPVPNDYELKVKISAVSGSAIFRAMARPMPRAPPVTRTTLFISIALPFSGEIRIAAPTGHTSTQAAQATSKALLLAFIDVA